MLRSVDETCGMPAAAAEKRKLPLPASSAPPSEKQPRRSPAAADAPQPLDMRRARPSVIRRCASAARPHDGGELPPRPAVEQRLDPAVEAHFRRSLGSQYTALFAGPAEASSALTVDDHFARALGDTWLRLQDGLTSS